MKISKLHSFWIMFASVMCVVSTCGQAVFWGLFGAVNRKWVDKQLQIFVNQVLTLAKVKCKIVNPHNVQPKPGRATIIMCNHSSLYDIPISLKAFPNKSLRMLSKKELSKIPIMGGGMRAAEFPFVDRKNRHQAMKDLEAVQKLMESGIVIWIAPEGTRSKSGKLGSFKKGGFIMAIQANALIIPIGIRGASNILPAHTSQLNINQTAEVHVGQPIDASKYTLENKEELITRVHKVMEYLIEG